jgi:hypothetical protein
MRRRGGRSDHRGAVRAAVEQTMNSEDCKAEQAGNHSRPVLFLLGGKGKGTEGRQGPQRFWGSVVRSVSGNPFFQEDRFCFARGVGFRVVGWSGRPGRPSSGRRMAAPAVQTRRLLKANARGCTRSPFGNLQSFRRQTFDLKRWMFSITLALSVPADVFALAHASGYLKFDQSSVDFCSGDCLIEEVAG